MEVVKAASNGGRQLSPVVYVGGMSFCSGSDFAWYRADVESLQTKKTSITKKPRVNKKYDRVKISTAAELETKSIGTWTIIGEDIYYFGESSSHPGTCHLVKHNINDANPLSWETLSSYRVFSSCRYFIAPAGRKLYIFCDDLRHDENLPVKIYDLDTNTWENLTCNIIFPFDDYRCIGAHYAAVARNKDGEPTEILFYSLLKGSVLFFDLASGELRKDEHHGDLALQQEHRRDLATPQGLEGCEGNDIANLVEATHAPAMLSNYTLYWFTRDLHLYGYDINLKRIWFRSAFLGKQLPTLKPLNACDWDSLLIGAVLADLGNGKFLVVVPEECRAEFTVAPFMVVRNKNSLSVSVESFHPLCIDDTSFLLRGVMAM